jgi:hypothetical protein
VCLLVDAHVTQSSFLLTLNLLRVWNGVLQVDASAFYVLYFLSFVFLCSTLFTNLIGGVVINALQVVLKTEARVGQQGATTFDVQDIIRSTARSTADILAGGNVAVDMRANVVTLRAGAFHQKLKLPKVPCVPRCRQKQTFEELVFRNISHS